MITKLAYFSSSTSWGGLEMNILRYAKWMRDRGHLVIVIGVHNSRLVVEAEALNIPTLLVQKQKKYYDFNKAKHLASILKENGVSHLVIRSTYDMSILASVKRKLKDKVTTCYIMAMQLGVKKTNFLHTLRYRYLDIWVSPLPWLKKQVEEMTHFKNELVLIPLGLELEKFNTICSREDARKELNLPYKNLTFGLIGRFDIQKGQLLLLEAMKKSKNKDYNIVLLGEPTMNEGDDYFKQIKTITSSPEIKKRVFIRPFRSDVTSFYSAIDWTVMATKTETFGMVTIESLACGTPVLGSNAGGTPELLEHEKGGVLFETMNSDDLANKIDAIIEAELKLDPDVLRQMVKKYDHSNFCRQFEIALKIKSIKE